MGEHGKIYGVADRIAQPLQFPQPEKSTMGASGASVDAEPRELIALGPEWLWLRLAVGRDHG